ncbi:hypothetical protein, partial [Rhizobium pusense]|uniref:hypothetical protein n=1 Tax=Agrobacterium pusense TaxID=648995 RepID=UPI002447106E|nr:hypothetical protein [Agrobacterium pusense]MDH1099323.1 hypothetical protein [Agrobacterium pusense]MDH2197611.1 hypothetical protein [Agrobacterium pusense]
FSKISASSVTDDAETPPRPDLMKKRDEADGTSKQGKTSISGHRCGALIRVTACRRFTGVIEIEIHFLRPRMNWRRERGADFGDRPATI